MKRISVLVLAILFCLMLILPAYAGDNPKSHKPVSAKYNEKLDLVKSMVWVAQKIPGVSMLVQKEEIKSTIEVEIKGKVVAVIQKGSKFDGIEVHEDCLEYQYGTDYWYDCEVVQK